jgi:tetratricopeptide (TPR) repeat protein
MWGLAPAGYHLVNVALHAANAVLLSLALSRLKLPGAWLAGALFAVHPVHVESVAWVTERKNVLSTFFYLLAGLQFLRFFRLESREDGHGRVRTWGLGAALFLAALLSKTVTASLPAALLLILWWKGRRISTRVLVPMLPLFVAGAAFGGATAWLEVHHVGARGETWDLSFLERVLIAGRALWFYAGKLLLPTHLVFVYPRWSIDAADAIAYAYPAAALGTLAALYALRRRIGRGPLTAALFFAGTLSPALGFLNVFPMRFSFVADHFQYLASAGLLALFAAGARRAAGAGFVVLLVVLTVLRLPAYSDAETLWRDTVARNPGAWIAHTNLGLELARRGRDEEAIGHFRETLRLDPRPLEPRLNLGEALQRLGRPDEAITVLREAVALHPESPHARYNLGTALLKRGRHAEGIAELEAAQRLDPGLVEVAYNLGTALLHRGRLDEAAAQLGRAVALRPDHADAHLNLARVLELQGRAAEAGAHRRESERLRRLPRSR